MAKKLELHKETLRSLSDEALTDVAGGADVPTKNKACTEPDTQTFACPSGATWFVSCESTWVSCA